MGTEHRVGVVYRGHDPATIRGLNILNLNFKLSQLKLLQEFCCYILSKKILEWINVPMKSNWREKLAIVGSINSILLYSLMFICLKFFTLRIK